MPYYLGIDIGTGSTKAVATDEQVSRVLGTAQVSYPTLTPQPHCSEQDPEKILAAFQSCLTQITAAMGESPGCIGISCAMHSVIPVDANGKALSNMITWADNRSADMATAIYQSPNGRLLYENTGTPIHAMSPLCKIAWLKNNEPDLFASTHKFISIKEYIWFHVFGEFEIDYSIASATGLFDIVNRDWFGPALETAGIGPAQLSTPVPPSHARKVTSPSVRQWLTVSEDTAFVIGASDGCLANLGTQAIAPGIACLTIGTSGAVRMASREPRYNFGSMTFNFILDEETFICGGPINNGGVVLKWFMQKVLGSSLSTRETYATLLKSIEDIPAGSEGLLFLPYLLGERAPIWNSHATGVFYGLTIRHEQRHFIKAVIEGISFALCSVARALADASGKIIEIQASGGFVQSREWLQILCDILNIRLVCNKTDDASAIGAVLMAKRSVEGLPTYPVFSHADAPDVFHPNPAVHAQYSKVFENFTALYGRLSAGMTADK